MVTGNTAQERVMSHGGIGFSTTAGQRRRQVNRQQFLKIPSSEIQPVTQEIVEIKEQDSGRHTDHNTRADSSGCSMEIYSPIGDERWSRKNIHY